MPAKKKTAVKPKATKKTKIISNPIKPTVVTMLLDESGSMGPLFPQTVAGFNEYVSTLQKADDGIPTYFSAIKFDTRGVRILQRGANLKDAITLDRHNYQPSGGTPLLDAIAKTIQATDEVAGKEMADKVIVAIQTDGHENASTEYTLPKIKTMVEERTAKGWQFVFIGAGIDAFAAGSQMGFQGANTMSYGVDARSTRAMFAATANNSAGFRSGNLTGMGYDVTQSAASGEAAHITRAKMEPKAKNPLDASVKLSDLNLSKGN